MLLGEDERLVANLVAEMAEVEVEGKEMVVSTMTLPETTNTKNKYIRHKLCTPTSGVLDTHA
jgi:hypothetical protein